MTSLLARLPLPARRDPRRAPLPATWRAVLGAVAVLGVALAGLALATVVVQTLDPSGAVSAGAAVGVAARLWLLAVGGTLHLPSGPVTLAPLLLTLAIALGCSRAARWALRAHDELTAAQVGAAVGGVAVPVAALTGLVAALAGEPPVRAVLGAALLALVGAGTGALRETGLAAELTERLPGPAAAVGRAALAGLLALAALCTAVVAVALAADARGYAAVSASLGGAAAGALGLLALGVLLLPNAAAAALGLAAGPGFAVGSATVVSVHGVTLGPVPALPLLAALPDTQAVPLLAFLSQAVPALAGLVAGATLGRSAGERSGGALVTGLWGAAVGVLLGVLTAAAVAVAGGSLGDGALATVGAPPLATGLAVALQSGVAAVLAAAVTRGRGTRRDGERDGARRDGERDGARRDGERRDRARRDGARRDGAARARG